MSLIILLVEDHNDTRDTLHKLLNAYGHTVRTAPSVDAAIDQLRCQPPADVVLLDIMLPGRGGLELLPHIPPAPAGPRLAVLSAMDPAQYADQLPPGTESFVKPTDFKRMLDWLAERGPRATPKSKSA